MTKVANYVAQKLEAEQLYYVPHAFHYKAAWQMTEERRQEAHAQASFSDTKELEFVCNGQAIPFNFSLAAVRSFLWRRSDTLVINFRKYNPSKPALIPTIKPP